VSAQLTLFPPFLLPGVASPFADVIASCHTVFLWSQDELAASTSSIDNASSHCLPSRVEIKALNLHHRRRPPSLHCPTHILHCYKKFISTLDTLPHHSTASIFYLLPSQRTTSSELDPLSLFSFTIVPRVPSYNDIDGDELADPPSFLKQLTNI
jgi:hypothetical protein